jgi:peptide/nickel transport system permease protein
VRKFILRRLGTSVIVFIGLITVAFFLVQILPGNPAQVAAGREATPAQIALVGHRLGLDKPLYVQYIRYFNAVLHGNLGTSVFTHRPVLSDIGQVLPSSIELVIASMIINLVVAVPLGVLGAYRRGRAADIAARLIVLLGAAMPAFWLALVLQLIFADDLKILPLSGQLGLGYTVPHITGATTVDALISGHFGAFFNALEYLLLPAVTLSASYIAVVARVVRSSMVGVLDSDFVTLARSTGASEWRVVIRHGLRNAFVPASTILGMQLGWMLGNTVLVESTFNRTGIGSYMVNGVLQDDLYAVVGGIITIGVVFLVANFAVDLLQLWLNPRLREPRQRSETIVEMPLPGVMGVMR